MQLSRRGVLLAMGGVTASLAAPKLLWPNATKPYQDFPLPVAGDWDVLSKQFLISPELSYLNTGALGATHPNTLQAVASAMYELEKNPSGNQYDAFLGKAYATKEKIAALVNCNADDLIITGGTTDGMALVLASLHLLPGQRVLISSQEYGRIKEYWDYYSRQNNIELDVVELPLIPRDEDEVILRIEKAIRPQTRVIGISHVTTANGVQMPVAAIATLAQRHGCLFVVDGAQAVGAVPVDIKALGCDIYAASGHKWLLGPKGTGFLYIAQRARDQIYSPPLLEGYGKTMNNISVQSLANIIGLGASIDWLGTIGNLNIKARLENLRSTLYNKLLEIKDIEIVSPSPNHTMASPMIAFRVRDAAKHASITRAFLKNGIVAKYIAGNPQIDIRVGAHIYNTDTHIDRFIISMTN